MPWDGGYIGAEILETWDVVSSVCDCASASDVDEVLIELLSVAVQEHEWTHNRHGSSLEAVSWEWERFVEAVKTESRFVFMPDANLDVIASPGRRSAAFLWSLLPYVDNRDLDLLLDIPAGSEFFRGRLVPKPTESLRSAKDLGPAPAGQAAANRMSPEAIPMFYASASAATAVREIAAHGTQDFARIGTFRNQRALTVLDLTGVLKLPSIFDLDQRDTYGVFQFFRDFAREVTAPLLPDSRPHIEYAPTQVVTEFFRWVPTTRIDGIRLRSGQDGEPTYVLFFNRDEVGNLPMMSSGPTAAPSPAPTLEHFGISGERTQPVFTLDPEEVQTYRVIRRIESELV